MDYHDYILKGFKTIKTLSEQREIMENCPTVVAGLTQPHPPGDDVKHFCLKQKKITCNHSCFANIFCHKKVKTIVIGRRSLRL